MNHVWLLPRVAGERGHGKQTTEPPVSVCAHQTLDKQSKQLTMKTSSSAISKTSLQRRTTWLNYPRNRQLTSATCKT